MAGRKSWESLSPAYRDRLSRGGITKSKYESGASLSKARGHAKTPEHPREAIKNPQKFPGYKPKKEPKVSEEDNKKLSADAVKSMDAKLGFGYVPGGDDVINYDPQRVRDNVAKMTTSQKIWTITASEEDLRLAAKRGTGNGIWWYH